MTTPEKRPASIVIPAWNGGGRIGGVVRAALGQSRRVVEVIVVDDGSVDSTALEAERAGARVIRQENRGPAAARNAGWRASSGEVVFFTDSDCYPVAGWVERLLSLLEEEGVGAAGGSYGIANPRSILAVSVHEEIRLRHRRMGREVRFLGSFNMAVPKRVLEETGGFDDSYRSASGEDNDLSYRIRKSGYRLLFDREALVDHIHPEKTGRYMKEQARHGYWRMKLYREHPEKMGGDDYSGATDYLEPPAAAALLLLLPLSGAGLVSVTVKALFLFLVLSSLFPAVVILLSGGETRAVFLWPIRFARSFARGIGMAAGIIRFWLLPLLERKPR